MAVVRRAVRYLVIGLGILILSLIGVLLFLTRTGPGVQLAGRLALDQIRGSIHGDLRVDGITAEGSLLGGLTLHGVALTDDEGRPFIEADSARLRYRLRTLLRGSIVFDRVIVHGAEVTLEQLPGQSHWNYDRILGDTSTVSDTGATEGGPRRLILIQQAAIQDADVTVRFPWDEGDPAADTTRLILESVPGGRVQTFRFRDVQARLPRIVWQAPESESRLVEVEDLAAEAYIWDTPAPIEELDGVITIRDSVISIESDRVRLPSSELRLAGSVIIGAEGERYDLEAAGSRIALQDFQWLYPALPAQGGGSLRFRMQTQEDGRMLWLAEDADLETQGNRLTGSFGIITGGTPELTNVDLRARPLDLAFLAGLLPDSVPLTGLVIGEVAADGPLNALRTRGRVRYRTFDPAGNGAESEVSWNGVVGGEPPYVMRGLQAELLSVDLAQLSHFAPDLALTGQGRGTIRAEGSLDNGLRVQGSVSADHEGLTSSIRGSGWLALGGTPTFDLQLEADPVSLELLAAAVPVLEGLNGEARGPITVSGSLQDLTVDVDLMTPAGELVAQAGFALTGPRFGYRAESSITEFRVDRVVSGLPETRVTGRLDLSGSGTELGDLEGRVSADLLSANVGGVELYRGALRGSVSGGLARVDSLMLSSEVGDLQAQGTFGLVEQRPGELAVNLRADSLALLDPVLFPQSAPLELGVDRVARVGGTAVLEGSLNGSLTDWRASGIARVRSLLYGELELGRGTLDANWERDTLRVGVALDSLRQGSRRLATVQGTMTYAAGVGQVQAEIRGRRAQQLDIEGSFEPQGTVVNLGLRSLRLATRDGQWALQAPATAAVGREGVRVDTMVLVRSPAQGRIRVAGVLPWRQPEADEVQMAALAVDIDGVRIGELLRVTQTDTLVDGIVRGSLEVTGTALQPRIRGQATAVSFRYGRAALDSVGAELTYEALELEGSVTGWRDGAAIVSGQGRVPVQLALTQADERLLDESMDVRLRADGVPAGLLAFLAPGFTNLEGRVEGEVSVVGTPLEPDLRGTMQLRDGAARFEPLAVVYNDIQATARMTQGTEIALEATLRTQAGRGRIQGTLDLEEPTDPAFDLTIAADRLDAAHRRDVTAIVNGEARVRGSYTRPIFSGDIQVVRGEMDLDEIWRQYQIVQLDTSLFQMLDTTQVSYRPTPDNPFLANLQVTDMNLQMRRNFWLRSRELNVEVGGSLALEVDRRTDDLRLTGTLQVTQGSYQLLARRVPGGRRFEIRDGTIEFVGTPGIDPNLNIEAAYRVRRAQGDPINVIAQVTGTLQDPRVQLSSDADVPMSETDLAGYILFGRAGAQLTQAEADVASEGLAVGLGLLRPAVSSLASTELQRVATSLGLPVDYVALSLPEYDVAQYRGAWEQSGGLALLRNAQLEIGFDPAPNVSVIGSVRYTGQERASALRMFGARVEYRPWQTWTIEGFMEDQFARVPSFGAAEIADRKVLGLSLFREWGY
jgi:autotransporter translocation and assembly factor TamB